jgi:hypothetical protein
MSEQILRISFRLAKWNSFISIESFGKIITVDNSEDSGIDIKVHSNIEIPPGIVFALIIWEW